MLRGFYLGRPRQGPLGSMLQGLQSTLGNVCFPTDSEPRSGHRGMSQMCQQETHAPQQFSGSFDHLVGAVEERGRNCEANGICCFEIDDELEFGRLFNWNVGGFAPFQHLCRLQCILAIKRDEARAIGMRPPSSAISGH